MKKIISWLFAMASCVALADSAATYHSLSWSVPASAIADANATFVNLYAEVGGVRVGSDGRKTSGSGELGLSTTSVVMGEGGWDWSGKDIAKATFCVEFLNSELGVIATATNEASYAELVAAEAFTINGSGSFVPVNGTTPYSFSGTSVGSDGVYEYLKELFNPLGGKVIPVANADSEIIDYMITITNDLTGPLSLNANLGKLTLDLQGHSITGTNAVCGVEDPATGGNAIEITGQLATSLRGATDLEIISDPATGYRGTVAGGRGADSETGTQGGYAIYSAVAGVTVRVGSNADVIGGASGNSITTVKQAGQSALSSGITLASGTVIDGQEGTGYDAWAWAVCTGGTTAGVYPEGTFFDSANAKIWFYKRTADATNPTARALFDFSELSTLTGLDGIIHFVDKKILVDQLDVPATPAIDLTFVGEENTVLAASGLKSAFDVVSSATQTRVWTNLAFTCEMPTEAWDPQGASSFDGGAIHIVGGIFSIVGCSFDNLGSSQLGGAVCAEAVAGDSKIVDSEFVGNDACNEINGSGGAVYASAATVGVTLSIANCSFSENMAEDGGAISSETVVEGDKPIVLDVVDSTFAKNSATAEGGAIFAEGALYVNTNAVLAAQGTTIFTNNFAGVDGGAVALNGVEGDTVAALVKMCRGVKFFDNVASNALDYAAGGAIYSYTHGEQVEALGVMFAGNKVYGSADYGVYGGAVFSDCGTNSFDTCVFDGNKAIPLDSGEWYYGGAIEHENGTLALKNSSFRNQNLEAVDAYNSTLSVTNCVLVGNGSGCTPALDLNAEESIVALAYNAWGTIVLSATPVVDEYNLTNRTTDIYESADSLHLRSDTFNAVAALGLPQPGVYDYDEVEYGSLEPGSSMGAFEAGTIAASVNVNGTKTYDGNASSNGCVWAFTTLETDPDLQALGDVSELVTVTNWWFGNKNAGYFAGTNDAPQNIIANVDGKTEEIRRWIEAELIVFTYDGTINPRDVSLPGLSIVFTPDEYKWTGDKVNATIVVTDTLPDGGELLTEDDDYSLVCSNNVNPTASAIASLDMLRNYTGVTNLTYAITAYFIEYAFDDEVRESMTETYGETSPVVVVKADIDEVAGYAFDKYYSLTNAAVRRADATDGLLRLKVLYCTDSNADGVPDKYQRKVLAKVVKGEWSQDIDGNAVANGQDVQLWSTLWKDGKWDATGTGTIDSGVPTAGTRPTGGYSAGGWLGFDASGNLVKVSDPATFEFSTARIPFLIYAYSHTAGTSSATSGRGRGTSRGGSSTVSEEKDLLDQYSALMTVKDATFTGTQLKLKTQLVIKGSDTTVDVPVSDTELKLYFVEKLGEDWQSQSCVTDDGGVITVDLTGGKSGFYKVGL